MPQVVQLSSESPGITGGVVARPPNVPHSSFNSLLFILLRGYNALRRSCLRRTSHCSGFKELAEIQERALMPSDIDEHLELMFTEALVCQPRTIVELGVRGGTSTFVFERVANMCAASFVSVDIDDCSSISSSPRWHFFQGDDVHFASSFEKFCRQRNIISSVDLLFIDTSHYYDHTIQEIENWFPLLSPRAKVMFHDTNMRLVGPRKDGCFQLSWDNQRGVIRAIEEYTKISIDETKECVHFANGWMLRHRPNCNGFTILDRVSA